MNRFLALLTLVFIHVQPALADPTGDHLDKILPQNPPVIACARVITANPQQQGYELLIYQKGTAFQANYKTWGLKPNKDIDIQIGKFEMEEDSFAWYLTFGGNAKNKGDAKRFVSRPVVFTVELEFDGSRGSNPVRVLGSEPMDCRTNISWEGR